MFAAALVVFREILEASMIVTIILAATQGVRHRGLWVGAGVGAGVVGATLVGLLTTSISGLFDGVGQEVVNAAILFTAVALIAWHVVWMSQHGREMVAEMQQKCAGISNGEKHMSMLAVIVALAVMREGSEVVLMLQGLWASGAVTNVIGGGLMGLAAGLAVSALMYWGFVSLPINRVFTFTNIVLVLIAAGMAARAGNFLAQAGLLPELGNRLWDSSGIISDQGFLGQMLSAFTGYIAQPNGIELVFYVCTLSLVILLTRLVARQAITPVTVIIAAVGLLSAHQAQALEVLSPYVEKGEAEFEHQGYLSHDKNPDNSNDKDGTLAFGYSPTDYYRAEFEAEFERPAGNGGDDGDNKLRYSSFNIENTFQLAQQGEYWIDPALFYEMDFARTGPNNIIFGVLGGKDIGKFSNVTNLLVHKDYGAGDTPTGFIYSNQFRYRYHHLFEPGFELYGNTDGKARFQDQQLAIGPAIFGKVYTFDGQGIRYEVGYLYGSTPATPDHAVRWKLEYEFAF